MINMLVGTYSLKLKKGCIKIPFKMLSELDDKLYIGINDENIIYIISHRQFDEFSEHIDLSTFQPLLSRTIDESGNIEIPIDYFHHAYIEDECTIIGVQDHAELWNPTLWKQYQDDFEEHKDEYLNILNQFIL